MLCALFYQESTNKHHLVSTTHSYTIENIETKIVNQQSRHKIYVVSFTFESNEYKNSLYNSIKNKQQKLKLLNTKKQKS